MNDTIHLEFLFLKNSYDGGKVILSVLSMDELCSSGQNIFPTASAAGADMTDAAIKWLGSIPNEMYAPKRLPATVEKPEVITQCSSDKVISFRKDTMVSTVAFWKILDFFSSMCIAGIVWVAIKGNGHTLYEIHKHL